MQIPEEFMSRYLGHRKEDYEKCKKYFREKNFAQLEKIGHQLKGNGLTFGFPELSEIGREIEKNAKRDDLQSLKKALEVFSAWVREKTNSGSFP